MPGVTDAGRQGIGGFMRLQWESSSITARHVGPPNRAVLLLFGRAVVVTLSIVSAGFGFLAGARMQGAHYDPYAYATGASALFAGACAVVVFLLIRRRRTAETARKLETQIEELSDRNWELREAEEYARSLLAAQGDLIVRHDMQRHLTYANDAFCALAGRTRLELIGKKFDLPVLEHSAVTVLGDGTRVYDQKITSGTSARWIAWREAAVRTETGSEVQAVGRDVTDRVEAERALVQARDQAKSASRAKSRFLAMVSDEIRIPLNGMLGMADLLLDTELTAEQLTYAKAAKTSGETLLSLIEEILDFSKIEAGKLDLDARPFALSPFVEEAVELLSSRAQAKGIEIASFIDERLPAKLVGDTARLRQVMLNLAGNAIKFTEKGGVAVIVEPGKNESELRMVVRDTGIGIAPQDQARIFLAFEQADTSSTRPFVGTGLGLTICKRIVERMDGRIEVDSDPGVGTTFIVTLPLLAATDEMVAPDFTAPDLQGTSALIVSTAEVEASLLARRLGRWGAQTCAVTDARIAFALLPERAWDVLLVDFSAAPAMIADRDFTKLPVPRRIVLINPGEHHELPALKRQGFNGYLIKPVRAVALAARLRASDSFEHPPAQTEAENEPAAAPAARCRGLAVLVAEDNEINALLARVLLLKLGHRPTLAGDGDAAVESWLAARAGGCPYDLVLMDVQMPGMDGLEAARRIRAAETEAGNKPVGIVALTANASEEDRAVCLAAGMDRLLVKPLDREKLDEAIAAVVKSLGASLAA